MERASRRSNTSTIVSRNPATWEVLGDVPVTSAEDVQRAAQQARAAWPAWRDTPFAERAELILRGRDLLLKRFHRIVKLLCQETGKVRGEAMADLLPLCDAIGYYASKGERFLKERTLSAHLIKHKRTRVQYAPRGVVVNISPWNFPIELAFAPALTALLAGNVALIKPSEVTPLIALEVAKAFHDAGLPKDVLQVLPGYGDTGAALIQHADFVIFTGSVATGRKVAMACADRLIPYTLELGGKDPALVLEDADLDRAAAGITWGAFLNCGQICMSIERVYVVDAVADAFIAKVVEETRTLRQGHDVGRRDYLDVGSMTFPKQLDIIESHVEDARQRGAKILTGGHRLEGRAGLWYAPTVLTDVTHEMRIMREESFGPILPIMRVRDAEEALERANDTLFGLSSSVWTRDSARGLALARQINAGSVDVNDVLTHYMVTEAPYGGVKHSGVGTRRHGAQEIRKYCVPKTIVEDLFQAKRDPLWFPYSTPKMMALSKTVRTIFRRGALGKIKTLLR